jgi:hypothetical protein
MLIIDFAAKTAAFLRAKASFYFSFLEDGGRIVNVYKW